jgi:hypothetical protein
MKDARTMTGAKRKKSRKSAKKESSADVDQLRPGMPAKDSVVKVVDFISPQGTRYEIRKTTEKDPYDPPFSPQKKGRPKK